MITKFFDWLECRTGAVSLVKAIANRRWVKSLMDMKMLPAILFFLCVVQCITGFILWMHYSPSSQTAYESVFNIQYNLWGGWLLRGIHHFSAQVFVAVAILYIVRIVLFGMYRQPREVTFWLAMFLFFFGLGACLTGDLLPWTQNAYGATMVRVKYLTQIPFVGQMLYELACGGTTINNLTLTHFFALHVGIFAAGTIALLVLHAICDARAEKKILDAQLASGEVVVPEQKPGDCGGCRSTGIARWWSCQAAVNALGCFVAMLVVLGLALQNLSEYKFASQNTMAETAVEATAETTAETTVKAPTVVKPGLYLGVELGPPADASPMASSEAARPEWTFRGLYEYALLFSNSCPEFILIFCIPTALVAIFFLMPFIVKLPGGYFINLGYFLVLSVVMIYLTMASYDRDAKNESYQTAIKAEREKATAVYTAIQNFGGIRKSGALSMISENVASASDAEVKVPTGPEVFKKHCASCHPYAPADASATGDEIFRMETPCAPNLYGYGTRDWIAGWFDKDKIVSVDYYGYENSPFKEENMALFAQSLANEIAEFEKPASEEDDSYDEDSEESEDEEAEKKVNPREEIAKVIDFMVAEASLPAPRETAVELKKLRRPWKTDKGEPIREMVEYRIDGIDGDALEIYRNRCLKCHAFYDYPIGQKGHESPDLTAYASKEWTKKVIADASKFYKGNTMTIFHAEPEGSENNLMTELEIEVVSAWLTQGNLKTESATETESEE